MMAYLGTGEPSPFKLSDALLAAGQGCKYPLGDAAFCGAPVAIATAGGRRRRISYCIRCAEDAFTKEGFKAAKFEVRS